MVATVVWIGGLGFQSYILLPAIDRHLSPESQFKLLDAIRKRFQPLAWLSFTLLTVTGLTQMAANPFYDGFLSIRNTWASAILVKHVLFGIMLAAAAYQTWILQPKLAHIALLRARDLEEGQEQASLEDRYKWIVRINLILSLLVLAFTAIARTA
jgi:uncharacterized membrane protein